MPNKPLAARAGLVLAGLVLAGAFANGALAEPAAYPHKVVTLVTHSSPGGGSDVFLREMSKHLGKYINATFVVENVQGGSGARAMARLAAAKPDGSVFYATTPTYIYTSLLSKPANTYRDLEPLVNVFTDAEVVYTRVDGPFQSLKDVIAHAKDKRGRWGVANPASLERMAAERLKQASGVNAAVVSHEGGGDMMINVLNGTLDIGIGEVQEIRVSARGQEGPHPGDLQRRAPARLPGRADGQGIGLRRRAQEVPRPRRRQGRAGRDRRRLGEGGAAAPRRPGIQEGLRRREPGSGLRSPRRLREVHQRLRRDL